MRHKITEDLHIKEICKGKWGIVDKKGELIIFYEEALGTTAPYVYNHYQSAIHGVDGLKRRINQGYKIYRVINQDNEAVQE